jgi:hypothetical protein
VTNCAGAVELFYLSVHVVSVSFCLGSYSCSTF